MNPQSLQATHAWRLAIHDTIPVKPTCLVRLLVCKHLLSILCVNDKLTLSCSCLYRGRGYSESKLDLVRAPLSKAVTPHHCPSRLEQKRWIPKSWKRLLARMRWQLRLPRASLWYSICTPRPLLGCLRRSRGNEHTSSAGDPCGQHHVLLGEEQQEVSCRAARFAWVANVKYNNLSNSLCCEALFMGHLHT